MNFSTTLSVIFLAAIGVLWLLYIIEAFGRRFADGMLTLLVPFYVLYFACIKSVKSRAYYWALIILTGLLLLANTMSVLQRYR